MSASQELSLGPHSWNAVGTESVKTPSWSRSSSDWVLVTEGRGQGGVRAMGVIAWDVSLKDEGVWVCRGHTFQREPLPQVHVA